MHDAARMTRVLVTGAHGFLGRHAVPALRAAGYAVWPVPAGSDLLDPAVRRRVVAEAGASHLLHLAWIATPGVYWRAPANLDWVAASLDLLRLFGAAGGTRAVLAGSCAEYAWGPPRLAEDAPCEPATLYGAAKDATRRLAMAYAREAGLSVAWARLFFLYGPGERPGRLVSDAIAALRAGEAFPTSVGSQRRDFLHVADAAQALVTLLGSAAMGAVNIGSGEAVTVRSLLGTLADRLGGRGLLQFGARPMAVGDPAVIEADVTRLSQETGFLPRFDLAAGLVDSIAAAMAQDSA
ncbi:MAG: NAD(P)-dependent oxidoreductase [Nevskia sp.]|nr:NAD(P)-dependent oxidoreductase [Nevskia sp.]